MARVKTFVEDLANGYEKTLDSLDRKIEGLGNVRIKSVTDSVYPSSASLLNTLDGYIERIVIYSTNKEPVGKPWKPTIDTDLMEFMSAAQPPHYVRNSFEEIYAQGKKTVREVIAMPYGWFKDIYCGGKDWVGMQKVFRRYGFKFRKKGFVVKD